MSRFEHVVETIATHLERDRDFGWFAILSGLVMVSLAIMWWAR